MTVVDFINRKNEILEKHTGIILVPEDQIKEVEKRKLTPDCDEGACPYCRVWMKVDCKGCPMHEVGNSCLDEGSTYQKLWGEFGSITGTNHQPWYEELMELIYQYNEELDNED